MNHLCIRLGFAGLLTFAALAVPATSARAADPQGKDATAPVRHRIMVADYNPKAGHRLLEISPEGKVAWEHKTSGLCVQFQILPNGHIVYGYGGKPTGTREIDRSGKVIWNYTSSCPESVCFERRADGHTLVAETAPCQIVDVTPAGKVINTLKISTSNTVSHSQIRRIQRLPNGNTLTALSGEGVAREFRPDGSVAWEYGKHNWMFQALRLPSGNTLVSCGTDNRVVEVDPSGKVVWELKPTDIPEVGMVWTTSVEELANGHLLIGNFMNGRKEPGAHCFEITRDKKVVWQFADPKMINGLCQVMILDEK
jgi:outer membrane protein assembly factor BamB